MFKVPVLWPGAIDWKVTIKHAVATNFRSRNTWQQSAWARHSSLYDSHWEQRENEKQITGDDVIPKLSYIPHSDATHSLLSFLRPCLPPPSKKKTDLPFSYLRAIVILGARSVFDLFIIRMLFGFAFELVVYILKELIKCIRQFGIPFVDILFPLIGYTS